MLQQKNKMTICYFGIYRPDFSRSKIYINGLKQNNVAILECYDHSPGLKKFFKLFVKHWQIRKEYDAMIVGHTGQITVFFAKLITRKPIIFDALCSLYEANIISRSSFSKYSLRGLLTWAIDWLACFSADLILVESNEQKKFFIEKFKINPTKCLVMYTGADDSVFYPDPKIKKNQRFTVLFRGRLMPEAGVSYVLDAAKIVEKDEINFVIIGFGIMQKEVEKKIKDLNLQNLIFISEELEIDDLRNKMLRCHISLGWFEDRERLKRTIPHKAFESLAMKLPYVTGDTLPLNEIFTNMKNCLLIRLADPIALANAISELKDNYDLRCEIAEAGYELYSRRFSPHALGGELKNIINNVLSK